MTLKVLTDDTQQIVCCSGLHSAIDSSLLSNLQLDTIDGETLRKLVKFREDLSPLTVNVVDKDRSSALSLPSKRGIVSPILDPADLVGGSFQ
jgi:hypothetical protein